MSWQCLKVEEFFNQYNWLGTLPSIPETLVVNDDIPWQCQTVKDFFSNNNWLGKSVSVKANQPLDSTLSLTLPVQEFLELLSWEGNPEIAQLPQVNLNPEPLPPPSPELNLTDLSDLF